MRKASGIRETGLKIQQLFSLMSSVSSEAHLAPWEGHTQCGNTMSVRRHTWGAQSPNPPARQLACGTTEKPQGIFHCDIKRNTIISVPGTLSLLSLVCSWMSAQHKNSLQPRLYHNYAHISGTEAEVL